MQRLLLIVFVSFSLTTHSQSGNDSYMLWTELGMRGDLVKKTDWIVDLNSRFDNNGLATIFPQVGIEYKVKKWFRPSVEYRFLIDKNKYGNYKSSHRVNINARFKENVDRFEFGLRLRYQYSFQQFGPSQDYNADFDQAIRIKPSISYDINNSIITPTLQSEFFYNPQLGKDGRQFNKMRIAAGVDLELDGPHSVSFKYQIDYRFNNYAEGLRHVLSLSYGYKF